MSSRLRIAVFNTISARGLERFPAEAYTVGKGLADADALLLRSHVLKEADIPASVRAIGRAGAGVNNAPGADPNAGKELVLAAILAASRNLVPAAAYVQALSPGEGFDERVEEGKKQFAGHELPGRTLGVIGLGAIGGLVAD